MNRLAALRSGVTLERGLGLAVLALAVAGPLLFDRYWISFVLTQTIILGIVAASLIFLSAYGGMVSLAQVSLYGIAGFVLGNAVTTGETKGLNLGWDPWVGVVLGIAVATAIGLLFGAISSRATGIYFLMITLTFSVLANFFFGQVTVLSGFGGISNIDSHTPGLVGDPDTNPNRLYYVALVVAVALYLLIRYVGRTPFGLVLQGVRDDPVRVRSLGYNAALHRALAFGFASFVASIAGVLFVWWNGHIDPATIDIRAVLDVLVIAVIGGLHRLEGAWLGAFVFVVLNNYIRDVGFLGYVGLGAERFHTVIGLIFLIIVLVSPGGLLGVGGRLRDEIGRRRDRRRPAGRAPAVGKPGVP